MKPTERNDYAKYRMEKSRETLEVAALLVQNGKWNSAVNRLYYAAYYQCGRQIYLADRISHIEQFTKFIKAAKPAVFIFI